MKKSLACICSVLAIILLLTSCVSDKYANATGSFTSSNGSTLEVYEITDDTITYDISIEGFYTTRRTDPFFREEGKFIAYYLYNGLDLPLIHLVYDEDLDCWKNKAIVDGLDFYRN